MGLSVWAIAAIICNSVVGVLILILFGILYKACQVPSQQEKAPATKEPKQKNTEQKCLLTQAWQCKSHRIRCSARHQICLFPFCFCWTSFVWFAEQAEPRGVARPTTISSPNPLICAACCSTVHLPTCLLFSTRPDRDFLLCSPFEILSLVSPYGTVKAETAKSQRIKTWRWENRRERTVLRCVSCADIQAQVHSFVSPPAFHRPSLQGSLKKEWKHFPPVLKCLSTAVCTPVTAYLAQGSKWTLWTRCCFDWSEPSASVWCCCCMMGCSRDNRIHVSSKALQIFSVCKGAFYKM